MMMTAESQSDVGNTDGGANDDEDADDMLYILMLMIIITTTMMPSGARAKSVDHEKKPFNIATIMTNTLALRNQT